MIKINNRRYIGCKYKLLEEIDIAINELIKNQVIVSNFTFSDLFCGTGVVADYYSRKGHDVTVNDNLYHNFVSYNAFFGNGFVDKNKLKKIIKKYNELDSNKLDENYFSDIYGNKYFSINDAKKIGYIRDNIESIKDTLTNREYYYLITSLIYACDKISNTVGHFESYLKNGKFNKHLFLEDLDIQNDVNNIILNDDANLIASKINSDVVYIDPPYNARQYVNFYHVLENLARWNKPTEFEGESMKFKRNELKSGYCRNDAPLLFDDLLSKIKCKCIIVSYSNTYNAKSTSSINKISEKEMESILSKYGKVSRKEIDYKAFNSGKTDLNNHKEYLYICEVI